MKQFKIFIIALVIGCSSNYFVTKDFTTEELKKHIKYLASDNLEGRRPSTVGNELAANYIAREFSSYGLIPPFENQSYFQEFSFVSDLKTGPNNKLNIFSDTKHIELIPDVDYRPLAFSNDTSISGPLVFVGYGISADSLQYDDYSNVDVSGKIVLILRYSPDGKKQDSPFADFMSIRRKVMLARERGASGILFVTGAADDETDTLPILKQERYAGNAGIAVIHIKRDIAYTLFQSIGQDLNSIQKEINEKKNPNSFEFQFVKVSLQTHIEKIIKKTSNVIGYLKGNDPTLMNEYIIIGAHFDHIGMGGEGSGSLQPETITVHNGADDNASGVAGLLELAQHFSANKHLLRRSLVFAAFNAEELGLLGSSYYTKHPPFLLQNTVAMINMDMIGRLRDSSLVIQGVGTSIEWMDIITRNNSNSTFKLKLGQDGFGSSDHASFIIHNIPVLFFFTGLHTDYHKPSDDWNLINYEGQKLVINFISNIIKDLNEIEKRPTYAKVEMSSAQREGSQRGFRVSFGILPDFGNDALGLKISGTRPGSPAEKAGLKNGDIIIKFGNKEIKNIYDLTFVLGEYKPGDEVEVVVIRVDKKLTLKVKLASR